MSLTPKVGSGSGWSTGFTFGLYYKNLVRRHFLAPVVFTVIRSGMQECFFNTLNFEN